MRHHIPVELFHGTAGTAITKYVGLGRDCNLVGVLLVGAAITQDGSNFVDFNVFAANGSTLLWNRDTDTGSDGSTVAGTVYGKSPDATLAAEVAFEAGYGASAQLTKDQRFTVSAIKSGSGVATDVVLTLIIEDGRDYS